MNAEGQERDLAEKLDSLELEELRELRKNVDRAISNHETRKRQQALSAAEQIARAHGFRLADLISERPSGKAGKSGPDGSASPAAYVNPENPAQTWSGRGRRPGWVNAALDAGRTLEDLAA